MDTDTEKWGKIPDIVRSKALTLFLSIDGTQRHYLINNNAGGKVTDFSGYVDWIAKEYLKVFDICFGVGIKTLICPTLIENNFWRGDKYIKNGLQMLSKVFLTDPFLSFYREKNIRVRLYHDANSAPAAKPFAADILALEKKFIEATPVGEQLLLLGVNGGSMAAEMIDRSIQYFKEKGEIPTEEELRKSWFPDGPARIDLLINSGWLISGGIIPAIFANNAIDLYTLNGLALDLSESVLREILYDHLFLRHAAPFDMVEYTPEEMIEMREHYTVHCNCLVGLGYTIGPGLWYPLHGDKH